MAKDDRCKEIELILSDVDGVLTDGGIIYDTHGMEIKKFHVRDGMGVKLWQKAGFKFGILTSRSSQSLRLRAGELGVDLLRQGCEEKLPAAQKIIQELGLQPQQVAYIGDDLPDLAAMRHVGLAVAVADAVPEVKAAAAVVTAHAGGAGAVREAIEKILKAKGMWEELIRRYSGQ